MSAISVLRLSVLMVVRILKHSILVVSLYLGQTFIFHEINIIVN